MVMDDAKTLFSLQHAMPLPSSRAAPLDSFAHNAPTKYPLSTRSDRPATARAVHSTITPHPCPPWTPLSFPPAPPLKSIRPQSNVHAIVRPTSLSLSLAPHPSFPFFPFACLNSCVCVWKFYASASESAACSSSHDFFASPSRMSVFSCGRIRVQGKRVSGGRMRCVSAQLLYLHYRRPDCRCPRTRPSP